MRDFDQITVKLYYNGKFQARGKHNEYIGGSVEYFNFVDLDKLGLIELWDFAEQVGFKEKNSLKFWHSFAGKAKKVRHLETDVDVLNIRNHIPQNYEVEIYLEHLEASSHEPRGHKLSDNELLEDEILQSQHTRKSASLMDHNLNSSKGKNVVDEREVSNEFVQDDEDDVCESEDGLRSVHDSDDEERWEDGKKEIRLHKQNLASIAQSVQDVLHHVEEAEIEQHNRSRKPVEQPSKEQIPRQKIVLSIQDKLGQMQFRVYSDGNFEGLFKLYAEKVQVKLDKLVFSFDGEKVSSNATPEALGMENDDIIEVYAKS